MSATKNKNVSRNIGGKRNGTARAPEVLTLSEAAAYLRVPQEELSGMVGSEGFPARRIGSEWRFLKSALDDWLSCRPSQSVGNAALLSLAGAWKDDPFLEEMVQEIYKRRGRPITEDE